VVGGSKWWLQWWQMVATMEAIGAIWVLVAG